LAGTIVSRYPHINLQKHKNMYPSLQKRRCHWCKNKVSPTQYNPCFGWSRAPYITGKNVLLWPHIVRTYLLSLWDHGLIQLIDDQHYADDDVVQRRFIFLARRSALLQKSGTRRVLLEDSNCFQQFERDCDKISEYLKFATDDRCLDLTNLNDKVQKHQNFDQ
jgi:hypothetical protein